MNKQEFKDMYGAARILKNAAYSGEKIMYRPVASNIAWDIAYRSIENMHPAISSAVWGWISIKVSSFKSIETYKWAALSNSQAFGAVKCRSRGTL